MSASGGYKQSPAEVQHFASKARSDMFLSKYISFFFSITVALYFSTDILQLFLQLTVIRSFCN